MAITKLQGNPCSVARSLSILGERWTLMIVKDALDGVTRFEGFRQTFGLAPDVLAERLNTLVEHGIMTRQAYREPGSRTRFSYHLTPAGEDLHLIIGALQQWGDSHVPWANGATIVRQLRKTGKPVHVAFVDERGREVPTGQVDTIRTASHPHRTRVG